MDKLGTPGVSALRQAQDAIIEHSLDRISSAHGFYRISSEGSHDQITAAARLGVTMFVDSVENPSTPLALSQILSVAPAALTSVITLEQTLALVCAVLGAVVGETSRAIPKEGHGAVRVLILTFGCDVGFVAAGVYAWAAKARGAWDARLESVAVDAMLRDAPEDTATRVGTADWNGTGSVAAIAAKTTLDALSVSGLYHERRSLISDCLVSVRGNFVLIVLGDSRVVHTGASKYSGREVIPEQLVDQAVMQVAGDLSGSAVVDLVVPGISHTGRSLRSALTGLRALPGWAETPNPAHVNDLLPERLLADDELAYEQILDLVCTPLYEMGGSFESTVTTYPALGSSLETTVQNLFVHVNAVRYRLSRVSEQVGWDATNACDGLMLYTAVIMGRLAASQEIWYIAS